MKYEEIKVGQSAQLFHKITDEDVEMFVKLSGDDNSIHINRLGMVHGALIISFISTFIGTLLPGDGAIWVSGDFSFIRSVHRGEEINIQGCVDNKFEKSSRIKLFIDVFNENCDLCVSCICIVKVPE